jgi:hypothetical protein
MGALRTATARALRPPLPLPLPAAPGWLAAARAGARVVKGAGDVDARGGEGRAVQPALPTEFTLARDRHRIRNRRLKTDASVEVEPPGPRFSRISNKDAKPAPTRQARA